MPVLVLLGPQRLAPVLNEVCAEEGVFQDDAPVALITSGWEEREDEDQVLRAYLGRPSLNLSLFARAESLFERTPELFASLRQRHDRMRRLRTVYRRRLDHAIAAWRDVIRPIGKGPEDEFAALGALEDGDSPLMAEVLEEAAQDVRDLDAGHLRRVDVLRREFEAEWNDERCEPLRAEREDLRAVLARCGAVLIAGGHVAVLLNRLRLFELAPVLAEHPVVGWAAGAMVLTERIVLFHDDPPQGRGHPEVFEPGLGLAEGLVVLPDAEHRLMLGKRLRVGGLTRRMQPARCVPLDVGERAVRDAGDWRLPRVMGIDGKVGPP